MNIKILEKRDVEEYGLKRFLHHYSAAQYLSGKFFRNLILKLEIHLKIYHTILIKIKSPVKTRLH
jgi:hypothetical protein